jgi:hypothetical protein
MPISAIASLICKAPVACPNTTAPPAATAMSTPVVSRGPTLSSQSPMGTCIAAKARNHQPEAEARVRRRDPEIRLQHRGQHGQKGAVELAEDIGQDQGGNADAHGAGLSMPSGLWQARPAGRKADFFEEIRHRQGSFRELRRGDLRNPGASDARIACGGFDASDPFPCPASSPPPPCQ